MDNYPHFVKKESEFQKNQRFVGSYMPDDEVEKLLKIFPNGCINTQYFSDYYIPYGNQSMNDYFNSIRDRLTPEQIKNYFDQTEALKKDNQCLLWDWGDLLHAGLWPMYDNGLILACGKGKIKANKHTIIIILDKVPGRVLKLWKEILKVYIVPMQEIAKRL